MKTIACFAAAGIAFLAAPASATVAHQTSLVHEGQSLTVSYEPKSKTNTKQTGLGSRTPQRCLWRTTAWVERKVTDASGKEIAALTRDIGESRIGDGNEVGFCNTLSASRSVAFGGDKAKLKAFVLAAAGDDAQSLRAELASAGNLNLLAKAR